MSKLDKDKLLSRKSNEATRRALEIAKNRMKPKKAVYPSGSLPAYAASYRKEGFPKKQADAMAQLAYGQKVLRKRLEALEAIGLAQMLGMVNIRGDLHLLECAKREDKNAECSCGSVPTRAVKESEG